MVNLLTKYCKFLTFVNIKRCKILFCGLPIYFGGFELVGELLVFREGSICSSFAFAFDGLLAPIPLASTFVFSIEVPS